MFSPLARYAAPALVVLTALAEPSLAQDPPAAKAAVFAQTGRLHTNIMAIGGETTGTIVEVPGKGTFELDFSKNPALAKTAGGLDDKMVDVRGTLTVKQGVEIPERRIVVVESLSAAANPGKDAAGAAGPKPN